MKHFLQIISLLLISVCSFSQGNLDRWTKQTSYYVQRGEYAKAIPYADSTAEEAKQKLGKDHWQYALFLDYLAQLYTNTAEYTKAEAILFEAVEILKKSLGTEHANYLKVADNLARVYQFRGQFTKAEIILLQINKVYKGKQAEQGADYAKNLDNLARLYERKFDYSKAQLFYEESLAIREKIFGINNESYALSLINIGNNLTNMLLYDRAEELFIQASKIYKNAFGEMNINYALSLDYLGGLYMTKRVIEKAEPLFIKAKEIHKKISGEISLYYANSLNSIGALYLTIGNYDKAEPLLTQAAEIRLKKSGPYSSDYAISLDNLANLFRIRKDYDKAEKYYKLASAIKLKQFGKKHLSYATSLNFLAIVAYLKEQYTEAESLYLEAIEIIQSLYGEKHPQYAGYINNLSVLYSSQKKYDKAERELLKAKTIYKDLYGEEYPTYITTQYNLGSLYIQTKQYREAELVITDATQASMSRLQNTFSILSEKEKENYLGSNTTAVSAINSLLYQHRNASPAFYTISFDQQLFFKSFLVTATRTILETISRSKDIAIKKLFDKWQNNRIILSKQYSLPASSRMPRIDSITAEAEAQEKELIQKSPELKNQKKRLSVNTQNVYDNLTSEEAAIEFVNVALYHSGNEEKQMYIAYILTKSQPTPIFVPLCEEKQLQKLLDSIGKSATSTAKVFYRGLDIKDRNTKQGAALYKLIWQPLESYLKGVKKISYSPAGKLYGIAFHALPIDSTTLLMDKYQLQQYTSTRQVALRAFESQIAKPKSIALFGDANFSMDSIQLIKQRVVQTENKTATFIYTPLTRSSNNSSWPSLPGTAEEVDKIKRLFTENKIATKSFIKTTASEENLKALSGNSPQILHIATHGFFLPEPDKKKKETGVEQNNTYTLADDPLLRSGLILSGGNYAWSGKTPIDGVEDGIATAYEISQLNLSNTELVVLSACETALGDVKGSEGVFGLQRAFKMAGVKKMIVSLWQVPDKETAELMTAFYSYWMKGKTINDAFAQAQADMRKKYSPFYWAAFVLVE